MANAGTADFNKVESRFFHRLFLAFTGLAVLSLLISFAGRQIGSEIAMGGHTDDLTHQEIVIGNDVLSLPANMIRYPEQRRDGIANRVDLYMALPDLSGFTEANRAVFNNQDKGGRLAFVSFEPRAMLRDMSGRYAPIYKSMIDESQGEKQANGLTRYHLPEKAGFLDEYLYVGALESDRPFVARCLGPDSAAQSLAPCDRDYHAGESLSMMVRFSAQRLDDWKALDASMAAFAISSVKSIATGENQD